jgi:hypothetical protein
VAGAKGQALWLSMAAKRELSTNATKREPGNIGEYYTSI